MHNTNLRVIRKPEVCNLAGMSNTSLFEQTRAGIFPPPISLGARAVGFFMHEVQAILAARSVGKSDDDIKLIVKALIKQREQSANDLLKHLAA
ncbi:AlpA family phage regulatory protein [Paraglaciecola chathamensis]|jgi:prophage regulatory protein|uniref:helix-turn-helix transcriptional regulator n=1 Tax=Paraglaciecola chathamensis TaxID=368405 RepID=UPI00270C3E17|nr:AlpA family phage regulatory protein [Paraglaciecola chathamensis]MDO6839485.1 AlpA family phage regulatory protein [Paraglaciecola chathamensis]|tara:strand:- start:1047 stop:1325 length:279 start_codon:yes stop_codon:yes gene_type:complete